MLRSFFIILFSLAVCEGFLRAFIEDRQPLKIDERNTLYRYDRELGWFPKENVSAVLEDRRRITVRTNSRGFRDRDWGPKKRKRALIVGDSFVWGYDADQDEMFTHRMQGLLPSWEIVNLGVSGYGTDQELLLLSREIGHYEPDAVVLVFCLNDIDDNSASRRYGYFKPYFVGREVQGVPVPRSVRYFYPRYPGLFNSRLLKLLWFSWDRFREKRVPDPTRSLIALMRDQVRSRGAKFSVALVDRQKSVESFLKEESIPCVSLEGAPLIDIPGLTRRPGDPVGADEYHEHWSPEGNLFAARKVAPLITGW